MLGMTNIGYSLSRSFALYIVAAAGVILFSGCATAPNPPSTSGGTAGRLIVTRSFALRGIPVILVIDGARVATITYNRDYNAPIAAGTRTLRLEPAAGARSRPLRSKTLVVQPGQTYRLTATRVGQTLVLQ